MVDPNDPRALRLAEMDREIAAGRQKMGNEIEVRLEDLPPLARKYVEENEGMRLSDAGGAGDGDFADRMDRMEGKMDADERGLRAERDQRIADEVETKATELMRSDPNLDHGAATRMAAANDANFAARGEPAPRRMGEVHGTDEDMREAAERRMKASPANYPDEAEDGGGSVGSTHDLSDADYQRQMKEAMERRGYDVG